jgi:hypothetical protein
MYQEKYEDDVPNGWDEHFCFNISEFTPGSAIVVMRNRKRERGVVIGSDSKTLIIEYRNPLGSTSKTHINSISFLGDSTKEWLRR